MFVSTDIALLARIRMVDMMSALMPCVDIDERPNFAPVRTLRAQL
jgi:hypothetical protein